MSNGDKKLGCPTVIDLSTQLFNGRKQQSCKHLMQGVAAKAQLK